MVSRTMIGSVLIVGASVAGVGAANELRRCGFTGAITLSDAQHHLPYDRPPLSKAALSDATMPLSFHDEAYYADQRIELALGSAAEALHPDRLEIRFAAGSSRSADAIVLATGARARRLPARLTNGPVHVIRDFDDAIAFRALLQPGRSLAMIGGGFIGAEAAATAAKMGLSVTIFDADPLPLSRVLGEAVAMRVGALHSAAGVKLVCGSPVERVERVGERSAVVLTDGSRHEADIVAAGLGAVPNSEWLRDSGVCVADGIVCDDQGRTSRDHVYAAGDVAAWRDHLTNVPHRHEHWTAAREQARIIAQQIAGKPESQWKTFVPYLWSDIHGKRVQLLGDSTDSTDVRFVFENPDTGAFVAEYRRSDTLIGVAGLNAAARVMRYASQLAR